MTPSTSHLLNAVRNVEGVYDVFRPHVKGKSSPPSRRIALGGLIVRFCVCSASRVNQQHRRDGDFVAWLAALAAATGDAGLAILSRVVKYGLIAPNTVGVAAESR